MFFRPSQWKTFLDKPLPARTHMADGDDIKRANEDLSRLLRASVFPGAVSSFPKRSVTHEMLSQADPSNPEFKCVSQMECMLSNFFCSAVSWSTQILPRLRVDKTHFSMKYEIKSFMEAEFARRNLFKQTSKEASK